MEKIPEEIKEQLTEENRQKWAKKTRIVRRDDGTKEQIQKWMEEDQERRNKYWTKKGRKYMEEKIKWGKSVTAEEREEAMRITWKYKEVFGEKLNHVRRGCKPFGLKCLIAVSFFLKGWEARVGGRKQGWHMGG